jgi:hypothetical protein
MWSDYTVPGGTYRENMLNTPGQCHVPDGHPAAKFRYNALKEKYADENGDITIDRREPVAPKSAETAQVGSESKTNGVTQSIAEIKVGA